MIDESVPDVIGCGKNDVRRKAARQCSRVGDKVDAGPEMKDLFHGPADREVCRWKSDDVAWSIYDVYTSHQRLVSTTEPGKM